MKELQYAAAANLLAEFIAEIDVDSSWQKAVNCLQAFDAWNRFDYQYALELFRAVGGEKNEKFLKVLGCLASSDRPAWESRSGYLLARDLLSNAARQAAQCRYEDAAARHYRAVELVAQTQLFMRHKITTASVMYDQIPSDIFWKPEIDNGPLEIGLFRAWELAAALDSKVGDLFNEWRARLKEAIKIRNMSLCAHGTAVITRSDYDNDSSNGMRAFASAAIKLLDSGGPKIPEFPRNLEALT
jgi:CRISPR-associated protein (TIGR02710 family)